MKNLNIALCALLVSCASLFGADDLADRKNQIRNMFINQYIPAALRQEYYNRLNTAATREAVDIILQDVINRHLAGVAVVPPQNQ